MYTIEKHKQALQRSLRENIGPTTITESVIDGKVYLIWETLATTDQKQVPFKIRTEPKDLVAVPFKWSYYTNPLDNGSVVIEQNTIGMEQFLQTISNILEKKWFEPDYVKYIESLDPIPTQVSEQIEESVEEKDEISIIIETLIPGISARYLKEDETSATYELTMVPSDVAVSMLESRLRGFGKCLSLEHEKNTIKIVKS